MSRSRLEQRHIRERRARRRRARVDAGDDARVRQGDVPAASGRTRRRARAATRRRHRQTLPGGGQTIARATRVRQPGGLLSQVIARRPPTRGRDRSRSRDGDHERTEKKLALLLEVSKGLSRAVDVDTLLDKIVELVFQILDVDRVAIMLVDDDGGRWCRKISRDRRGVIAARAVPQSIARKVVDEKVAILSDNAPRGHSASPASRSSCRACGRPCARRSSEARTRAGRAVRRQPDDDAPLQRRGSRVPRGVLEHRRGGASRTASSPSASAARRWCASNFERYFAPAAGRADRRARADAAQARAATSAPWPCCSATSAASRRSRETMKPDDVARLLSEYFTVMVEMRVPPRRHARQVHRRRGHGAVGRADRRPRRCRSRDGRGARHDARARDAQRAVAQRRAARAADRHRAQLRRELRRQHRLRAAPRVHGHRRCR